LFAYPNFGATDLGYETHFQTATDNAYS